MGWGESGGIVARLIMLGNKWGELSASRHGPATFVGGAPIIH